MRGVVRPTEAWQPTAEQIRFVREAYETGLSRVEIADELGVSCDTFDRRRAAGAFGLLPSRQGCRTGAKSHRPPDDEFHVFGLHETEWHSRRQRIQQNWTPEEAECRRRGILPNDPRPTETRFGREAGRTINTRKQVHRRDW